MTGGGVSVQEAGRALRVQTEAPHLVSLGGGRLSTAVTLHPIQEGRTTLGSGPSSDIVVQGAGVEATHCHIDNRAGAVTLTPVAAMTAVDNRTVTKPTRLAQGCMLCVGRSNYLRFNHPAEAQLMKNALPNNSRISVLPIGFYPGEEGASTEEIARYISPKVFPAGSSTVNSPASLVLGPRASHNKLNLRLNGEVNGHGPKTDGNIYQNVCALPNGQFAPRVDSPSPPPGTASSPRYYNVPSPAFDRNPSYPHRRSVTSPTNSWASSVEDIKGEAEVRRKQAESERMVEQETERMERQRLDEILAMCADYEKQAQWERQHKTHHNRIITNGSLPRDKRLPSPNSPHFHQSFSYDSESSPTTPDGHLGIPEPGSHPPSSPRTRIRTIAKDTTPTPTPTPTPSPAPMPSREYALEVIENRLAILNDYEILGPPPPPRNSSRNALTSPDFHAKGNNSNLSTPKDYCLNGSQSNNNYFNYSHKLKEHESPYKPGSIAEANALSKYEFFGYNPRNSQDEYSSYQNGFEKSTESLLSNNSRQRDSLQSTSTQNSVTKSSTKTSESEPSWSSADLMAGSCNGDTIKRGEGKNGEYTTDQLIMQLDAIVRENMKCCDSEDREKMTPSPRSSERDSGIAETAVRDSGIVESSRDGDVTEARDLHLDTRETDIIDNEDSDEVDTGRTIKQTESRREVNKFIMPLPINMPHSETSMLTSLRMERTQLVANLTTWKAKVMDMEQQEDECMRELEIEQALVGGELQAQGEKLAGEEKRVSSLRRRAAECEREMDQCVSEQAARQSQARDRLERQHHVLYTLEQHLMKCPEDSDLRPELIESHRQQQELVEAERKAFEDLEFSLLEEEAGWLTRREELQREVSEAMTRCAERRERLASLRAQRDQTGQVASANAKQLAAQLAQLAQQIEQGKKRLKEIDNQLKNPSSLAKLEQETEKKQSQDDIERISRVTSGAPMEMSSNSLGRRTIASLQEIERNRQLHLAKQGSLVIEEERKRVSELKRRVQDEARAEWEERRLRETNCQSVGSDDTTSDLRPDSFSSEDAEKRLTSDANENEYENAEIEQIPDKQQMPQQLSRSEGVDRKSSESRPISEASAYSDDQLSTVVRLRHKTSVNNLHVQRPLTRYLPIRGQALDLRQHIESAGHQVALCPHVSLDQTSCRGFLHKMTSRFHNWNKRWFVFDRTQRTLTYYSDKSERKARGGAYFQAIENVYVDHSNGVKSPNPSVTFVIKSSERTYHLVAPSPEAMRIWVDVVFTGAEGYQEFGHGS